MEKRVLFLIVEGYYDERVIGKFINDINRRNRRLVIETENGNMFGDKNVPKHEVKSKIGNYLNESRQKKKYTKEDVVLIAHIIDCDGNHEHDETERMSKIQMMIRCSIVAEVKYRLYYNSRHLDHVIANDIEAVDNEAKNKNSRNFNKLTIEERLRVFKEQYPPINDNYLNYEESIAYIFNEDNANKRVSNLINLITEFV